MSVCVMAVCPCRCAIDWKKGKNVTVKTIKKKQKHKGRGTVRTITKQVPNDSFFNFFSPLKGKRVVLWTLIMYYAKSLRYPESGLGPPARVASKDAVAVPGAVVLVLTGCGGGGVVGPPCSGGEGLAGSLSSTLRKLECCQERPQPALPRLTAGAARPAAGPLCGWSYSC